MLRAIFVLLVALTQGVSVTLAQDEVDLNPTRDNTLYEHESGDLSNGAGGHLFVGRVGPGASGMIRRAVLAFDVGSAVPEGATVTNVVLTLSMSRTTSGTHATTLHRLTSDWGEGTSDASAVGSGEEGIGTAAASGDATWIHTFFDSETWQTPGGDFVETPTADFDVDALGEYTVTSAEMIDDVQQWLDDPATNFGWILLGDEESESTTKRFDSRSHESEENRPRLTITYSTSTSAETPELPSAAIISGNYPNPFSDETTLSFELERPQSVSIRLYDLLGREVKTLGGGHLSGGRHEVTVSSSELSAGTYFYCLEGASIACGRMSVIR